MCVFVCLCVFSLTLLPALLQSKQRIPSVYTCTRMMHLCVCACMCVRACARTHVCCVCACVCARMLCACARMLCVCICMCTYAVCMCTYAVWFVCIYSHLHCFQLCSTVNSEFQALYARTCSCAGMRLSTIPMRVSVSREKNTTQEYRR